MYVNQKRDLSTNHFIEIRRGTHCQVCKRDQDWQSPLTDKQLDDYREAYQKYNDGAEPPDVNDFYEKHLQENRIECVEMNMQLEITSDEELRSQFQICLDCWKQLFYAMLEMAEIFPMKSRVFGLSGDPKQNFLEQGAEEKLEYIRLQQPVRYDVDPNRMFPLQFHAGYKVPALGKLRHYRVEIQEIVSNNLHELVGNEPDYEERIQEDPVRIEMERSLNFTKDDC